MLQGSSFTVAMRMLLKPGSLFNLILFTRLLCYKKLFPFFISYPCVCQPQLTWEINLCVAAFPVRRTWPEPISQHGEGCWVQKLINCLSSKQSSVFGCLGEKPAGGTRAKLIHFLIPELIWKNEIQNESSSAVSATLSLIDRVQTRGLRC